jgi:hypothetical protein
MRLGQIFIVGMNGSGTTMLLDCLAGHSLLYGFRGETKVLPYFIERQAQYGNLVDDANFARLWQDLHAAVGGRGWRRGVNHSAIEGWGERPRDVAAIFDSIMSSLAAKEGKQVWCEKTPMYVHHLHVLARAFPRAKFVHVIRDGRDCAASFHRRWHFNPVRTIFRWKRAVQAGRSQGAQLGVRYCEVRYEQLTTLPEESLRDLCRFLDVPFESEILTPARQRPQMTGSTATSIAPNERRAEQYFGSATLKKIESVAGRQLADCGYSTHYAAGDEDPPKWLLRWWEITDDFRRMKQALRTSAGMRKSRRLSYFSRRVLGALRQKRSLK